MKISVVVPVYNEEKVLPTFFQRLVAATKPLEVKYQLEFIFVDDGSKDNSLMVAKKLSKTESHLKIIELRRNYGQTAALQAGIDAASGDIIVTMDADLQHFPEEIPMFIAKIESGCDVVCGWRHDRQEGIIRRWPSRVANYLIRKVSKLTIHDVGTTFRAYRREILQDIVLLGENHRFIPVFAEKVGAKIDEIKIKNIERPVGQSNYGISRTLNVFIDLFFLYFYIRYFDRPIRIFGKISFVLLMLSMIIIAGLSFLAIMTGSPVVYNRTGWLDLAAILGVTGIQLLLTGILAEVLARVYYSSNGVNTNTHYKVRREWCSENVEEGVFEQQFIEIAETV